jgi:hypothetical protein
MTRVKALKTIWGDNPERLIPQNAEVDYNGADLKERIAFGQLQIVGQAEPDEDLDDALGDELPEPPRSHKKKK